MAESCFVYFPAGSCDLDAAAESLVRYGLNVTRQGGELTASRPGSPKFRIVLSAEPHIAVEAAEIGGGTPHEVAMRECGARFEVNMLLGRVMGRGYIHYQLPDSEREAWVLFSAFLDYSLPNGGKLSVPQQPAWCGTCEDFVVSEELPSVASFENQIVELRTGREEALQMWALASDGQPVEQRIAELSRYVTWRRQRESPPRCLHCGALEPVPVPTDGEFCHPDTGERVLVVGGGWADAESWVAEFSTEGEPIR